MDLIELKNQLVLSAPEFARLADVPPEAQWFANLDSVLTKRAYQSDLRGFMAFTGIAQPEAFRSVMRAHVLAWHAELEKQNLAGASSPRLPRFTSIPG